MVGGVREGWMWITAKGAGGRCIVGLQPASATCTDTRHVPLPGYAAGAKGRMQLAGYTSC